MLLLICPKCGLIQSELLSLCDCCDSRIGTLVEVTAESLGEFESIIITKIVRYCEFRCKFEQGSIECGLCPHYDPYSGWCDLFEVEVDSCKKCGIDLSLQYVALRKNLRNLGFECHDLCCKCWSNIL